MGIFPANDDFESLAATSQQIGFRDNPVAMPLIAPQGVHVAGSRVYVADAVRGNIQVLDVVQGTFSSMLPPSTVLSPGSVVVASDGTFYVADVKRRNVAVISADLLSMRKIGGGKELRHPEYLALNEQLGRLYVADPPAHQVVVFDLSGRYLFRFGSFGQGQGEFSYPHGLTVSPLGEVLVADTGNARVQVFDGDGHYLYQFGQNGGRWVGFERPYDLACDRQGQIHIVDQGRSALFITSSSGELLLTLGGRPSRGMLGLASPTGVGVDDSGRIVISDLRNHRLSIWQLLTDDYLRQRPLTDNDLQNLKSYLEAKR